MKRCPQCLKNYADETLNYCLEDGTLLTGSATVDADTAIFRSIAPNGPDSGGGATAAKISGRTDVRREQLLLTDFDNTTGEEIFDHTLKTALAFSLAQSPIIDILPDTKVGQTLRMMGRGPADRVSKELGEEICVRQNLKAFITGSISSFGSIYVLSLEAISRAGESIGREFEQVGTREEVLNALGRAATGLREKLGESLSSIEKFDVPSAYATTSSLEALKLYTLAREQVIRGKTLEAVPFYEKAIELDPKFATAYSALAVHYANSNQWKLAAEMVSRAYELRDTVSENEKLRFSNFYYSFVTGEVHKAIEVLELWRKTYPAHVAASINLSDRYEKIGQFEKAIRFARDSVRLDQSNGVAYMNLVLALLRVGRYDEVKETCRQVFEKGLDGAEFHRYLYAVAFIENDTAALDENIRWFSGRNDEYIALELQTGRAAFQGRWRAAQDLSRRSVDLAYRSNAKEVGAQYAAEQALRICFWSGKSGLPDGVDAQLKTVLKTQTNKALEIERGKEVVPRAALALAVGGLSGEAASLVDELHAERPKDTLLNELWLPTIRAAALLRSGKAKEALEELETAERFEHAGEFYPQYLRALAFAAIGNARQAIREFDKIIDHRGETPLSSIYPLAHLGRARATKDKAGYEKFFELWSDADKDMPALVAARQEYDTLN